MSALEKIGESIVAALEKHPVSEVLQVVTGSFVSLTVEVCRRQGHDINKTICIDGCGNRNITIHPPKASGEGGEYLWDDLEHSDLDDFREIQRKRRSDSKGFAMWLAEQTEEQAAQHDGEAGA